MQMGKSDVLRVQFIWTFRKICVLAVTVDYVPSQGEKDTKRNFVTCNNYGIQTLND